MPSNRAMLCWWRSQPKSQTPIPRSQNSTKSDRNTRIVHFSSLILHTGQCSSVESHSRRAPPKSRQPKSLSPTKELPILQVHQTSAEVAYQPQKKVVRSPRASDLTRGSICTCLTCRKSQQCYYTCCAIATLPSATLGCYRGSQQMSAMHA